jgi:hypothetical protein
MLIQFSSVYLYFYVHSKVMKAKLVSKAYISMYFSQYLTYPTSRRIHKYLH